MDDYFSILSLTAPDVNFTDSGDPASIEKLKHFPERSN